MESALRQNTAEACAQALVCAVFNFNDIMGATMAGKGGQEEKRLDSSKINAIIGKFVYFYVWKLVNYSI